MGVGMKRPEACMLYRWRLSARPNSSAGGTTNSICDAVGVKGLVHPLIGSGRLCALVDNSSHRQCMA